ncbi:hypothetical protein EDF43_11480 [Rathayibacter sp. PhB179]|nr:hypothetical protein EDF49_1147 [Rathayibacter sp. PhB192]TCM23793.1 hypothetical protein EDF43_11480 [Rathayibacter sp. PhB179]
MESAPSAHLAYVTDANRSPSGGAKGLARLMKAWKYANPSVKISSFYLEMRAAERMARESSFIPYLDFAYLAKNLASSELPSLNDPTGTTGRIRAASTDAHHAHAVTTLSGDAKRIWDAIALEEAGKRSSAFAKLDTVFAGTTFPAQFY